MTRILMGLAVAALTAGAAAADLGGFAPPRTGGNVMPANHAAPGAAPDTLVGALGHTPNRAPDRFGLLPGLRSMFNIKGSCDTCGECKGVHRLGCPKSGCGPHGCAPYANGAGMNPPANQGTLVFPQHPFVRAPRDFFMYEAPR